MLNLKVDKDFENKGQLSDYLTMIQVNIGNGSLAGDGFDVTDLDHTI